jgi:hypothetical protein
MIVQVPGIFSQYMYKGNVRTLFHKKLERISLPAEGKKYISLPLKRTIHSKLEHVLN